MSIRKKVLAMLLTAVLAFGLAACANKTDTAKKNANESSAPVPVSTTDWAKAPNGKVLVSPQWLNAVIEGKSADTYSNSKYMVLEASWGPDSAPYKAGHIPGAYHFNTDNIETEANNWNIGPVDHVEKSLKESGITRDTTIIVYSNDADCSSAARVVLALMWAGVDDVRILNGGLNAWKEAGYMTETKENKPVPVESFGVKIPQHPEYLMATPEEVLEAQKDNSFRLISIRSYDEFIGKTSGYSYIKGAGEPKGAIWGHDVNGGKKDDGYLNSDGTFKPFGEVEAMWAKQGITKDTRNAFYCGTGWRASIPWLMAYMEGWSKSILYDGGWFMWEKDSNLPVQKGNPAQN